MLTVTRLTGIIAHQRRVERERSERPIRCALSGRAVVRLMRQHRVTIRELSRRTGITQKRIRQVRERGLTDRLAARDWIEAITGSDPGPI